MVSLEGATKTGTCVLAHAPESMAVKHRAAAAKPERLAKNDVGNVLARAQ